MKPPVIIVTLFFLSVILFFIGFLSYSPFYNILLPDVYGIKYLMDLGTIGDSQTTFAIVFALIPVLLFFTWQLIPLYSGDKKTFTVLIVILCMALAVYLRRKMLVSHFEEMVESLINKRTGPSISYPFNELGFEYYLLGGLITGCIISYLVFHTVVKRR